MTNVQRNHYLLHLLADLSRDPALRERMASDPSAVIAEYGISPAAQAILRSRDNDRIAGEIGREVHELIARLRDYQPTVMMPWPTNEPYIEPPIAPPTGHVHTEISFTVNGWFFAKGATLTFRRPGGIVAAHDVKVTSSSDGKSSLTGTASFKVAGTYDVEVTNPSEKPARLPAGFTATVA